MHILRTLAAVLLALPVAAAADAQTPAITGYVDADGNLTRREIYPSGWGFTFRPTSDLFVLGLSFFNPEGAGGATGLGGELLGQPLATQYVISMYQLAQDEITLRTWTTERLVASVVVDNASTITSISTLPGGVTGAPVTGAFWTTLLTERVRLDARKRYGVAAHPVDGEMPSFVYAYPQSPGEIGFVYDASHDYESEFNPDWFSELDAPHHTSASFVYVTAVPEPSTLLLVGGGLGLIGVAARRRRRSGP